MRLKSAITITTVGVLAACSLAFAAVSVYENDFARRSQVKDLKMKGKKCEREFRRDKEQLGVATKQGPARCRLRLPVQGDRPQPDHIVKVQGKILKKTHRKVRKKAYLAVSVREGDGGFYELRVYPERSKYTLVRKPNDDAFPITGKDESIGKTGKKVRLRIGAIGDRIGAKVNKVTIPDVADPAPNDLKGRRISITLGQEGKSKKTVAGVFDGLSVRIPNP